MTNRVFFLGAGFSKAINPSFPTLGELTNQVHQSFCQRYEDGPLRAQYDLIAGPIKSDIEQLLSYLVSDWPWKTTVDNDLHRALFSALAFEVSSNINNIPSTEISKEHIHLIRYLNAAAFGIITLNYDILFETLSKHYVQCKTVKYSDIYIIIEDCFDEIKRTSNKQNSFVEHAHEWLDMPNAYIGARLTASRELIDTISEENFTELVRGTRAAHWTTETPAKLLSDIRLGRCKLQIAKPFKLHGSVDWTDENSETISFSSALNGTIKARLPLIVPPIADKSRYYGSQQLRDLWFDAHNKIEQADEIVLIGFSLPPTDISVRFLFQSALRNNHDVKITVVNADNSKDFSDRYGLVFSQAAAENRLDMEFCGRKSALADWVNARIPS